MSIEERRTVDYARWREEMYRTWVLERSRAMAPAVRAALAELPTAEAAQWLTALESPGQPAANLIAGWCLKPLVGWRCAAGLDWKWAKTSSLVLLAYPGPLSWDPVAMAAILPFWAMQTGAGWSSAVARLGPALAPVAYYGGIREGLEPVVGDWFRQFGRLAARAGLEAVVEWAESFGLPNTTKWDWPPWPEAAGRYRSQLEFGVVPHGSRGASVNDVSALLLALAGIGAGVEREAAAQLAQKAVLGWVVAQRWLAMGNKEE